MAQVRISYSSDLSMVGSVVDVDDDTARTLVKEGRAVRVPSGTRAELLDQAEAAGIDVKASATKAEIASDLAAANPSKE